MQSSSKQLLSGEYTAVKWLGVDTGGTFTDLVFWEPDEIRIHKVLSTPKAPEQAILQGIREMGIQAEVEAGRVFFVHGSTVATNAALERKGVRTAYIGNAGLKDVLTIGRQARPELYNLTPTPRKPPVPPELCFELNCRVDANGVVETAPTKEEISHLLQALNAAKPRAVAINFLFSFLNPAHEKLLREALQEHYYVSLSSEILPVYKEYERGIATWLNAWLGPVVEQYLRRLASGVSPCSVALMQSSGGTISLEQAADRAVNLLLSGPAGGLAAADYLGKSLQRTRLMTFDMGGTSTDVALLDGKINLTDEGKIADYPVAVPMVDMHTIGAGGGSIAWIDQGGLLQVGPESAGADPGPACYGKGGNQPTVTDANLVLGRIPESVLLGGYLPLRKEAAIAAMQPLAERLDLSVQQLAAGIVRIANEHMARALRVISVYRGFDPQDFALFCFGGAGGLHLCDLAENLQMREAIVPANAGVLSAFGMLVAPKQRNMTQTLVKLLEESSAQELISRCLELTQQALTELLEEGVRAGQCEYDWLLACRYKGQSFTLDIPFRTGILDDEGALLGEPIEPSLQAGESLARLIEAFHECHFQRYGYRLEREVELVTLRCKVYAEAEQLNLSDQANEAIAPNPAGPEAGASAKTKVLARDALILDKPYPGPMIVTDQVATLYLKSGWELVRQPQDHLLLKRIGD